MTTTSWKLASTSPRCRAKIGFRIKARPEESSTALAYYKILDFRSAVATIDKILQPNETVMIEIVLQRRVNKTISRMTNDRPLRRNHPNEGWVD